jgi:hypothetical protein
MRILLSPPWAEHLYQISLGGVSDTNPLGYRSPRGLSTTSQFLANTRSELHTRLNNISHYEKCILVFEDHDDNMQILGDLLASADLEMLEAGNG